MSLLPIESLIQTRSNELRLTRRDLVRKAGYSNTAKGLRRLDELYSGYFQGARGLIQALPAALDLPETTINQVIEESRRQIAEAKESAWRTAFVPHAIILTEKSRPEPLFVASLIGINQLKRVDFETSDNPVLFIDQALAGLQKKLERWKGQIPCFGKPTGIIINYTPDKAIQFDLNGRPVEIFDAAYRLGQASLSIRGREFSSNELGAVFGVG